MRRRKESTDTAGTTRCAHLRLSALSQFAAVPVAIAILFGTALPSLASAASTGQITGTVTAASGGAPLEEIEACAFEASNYEWVGCGYTGASGEYTIEGLEPGSYKVRFSPAYYTSSNYLTQWYHAKPAWEEADPVSVTAGSTKSGIDAQMEEGGQITGTVTAASGGAPLEEIEVCARVSQYEYGRCSSTNASGEYTISGLSTDSYKVEFSSGYGGGNYLTQYYDGKSTYEGADPVAVIAGSTKSGIDAQMEEGGQITGTVTAASGGAPINGIEVCAYHAATQDWAGCASTNASGEYTISGLSTDSYKVEFSSGYGGGNYLTQYYHDRPTWEEADPVAITAGSTRSGVDAQMHEGGRISGTVTAASGGAPLEGIQVCASASLYEYGHCASTNASGDYTISALTPASYKVRFMAGYGAPNYVTQWYDGKSSREGADPVSVTADTTTPGIDAQMEEGGQIKGTVTNASGGGAIAGIQVCASGGSAEEYGHCASTNASGEYTIPALPTGSYAVEFSPGYVCGEHSCVPQNYLSQWYDAKSTREEADPVSVTAGSTKSGIDAQMEEGGQIKGTVTAAAGGAPIEDIQVCATVSQYEYGSHCASTDGSGAYTIPALPTGSYRVKFSPSYYSGGNYLTQYYDGKSTYEEADPVAVTAGSTKSGIDAQMHEGGKITGRVTAASGGAPIEGIEVCAHISRYEYGHCASTNASGEYTIASLAPGSYKVQFSGGYICDEYNCTQQNYVTQYYDGKPTWEEATAVSVSAETIKSGIDAQMEEGGQIKGTVTNASGGGAIAGIDVCAAGSGGANCASTDSSGEYDIATLPTGSYKVEFSPGYVCGEHGCTEQNYLTQWYSGKATNEEADPVAVTAGSTKSGIDAQMHEAGQITGTVTKASGSAAEEVDVCAWDASGEEYEPEHCAHTNASGEYTISALTTGSYKVEFSGGFVCGEHGCYEQDYVTQWYSGKATYEEADPVAVTAGSVKSGIDAQMHEGGHITGKVTNASGGAAISGINVCAMNASGEYAYTYSCASTNASGEYTITRLPTGSYKVRFSPASVCGEYGCSSANYLTQYYDGKATWEEGTAISVSVETTKSGIDAQMEEGGQIKGTVTADSGGAAIEHVDVCAYRSGEEESRCSSTNASGHYTISALPTGSYKVEFYPETNCGEHGCVTQNYLTQWYSGKATYEEADPVAVTAGSVKSGIDAQMQAGGQVKGTVTEASGGAPVEHVEVCAYDTGTAEWPAGCASTNASGEYTLSALPTGSYKIKFSPGYVCAEYECTEQNYVPQWYDGKPSFEEANAISVTAGSASTGINAQMQAGGQITGTVTKASGGAIEGGWACAYKPGAEEPESCGGTDSAGDYTIDRLGTGSYQVEFGPGTTCEHEICTQRNYVRQFYNGKSSRTEADPVSVTAGATHAGIDAALQPGGQISGEVTAAATGDPVSGSWVCAYRSGEEEPESCGESNGSGKYVISGLSAGNHIVEFGPGWICGPEFCGENNYEVQFYNGKSSSGEADPVSVTVGSVQGGINAALVEPAGAKPVDLTHPALTGTPAVGEQLTCSPGTWENGESYATSWKRDGSVISGQTGNTYTVKSADRGHSITCVETATNTFGSTSATSSPLYIPAPPVNITLPVLSGTPAVGEELTCSEGTWENSPTGYSEAWFRGATVISGKTGPTYKVQAADQGYNITCEVTATNADGSASETSNALAVPAAAGAPVNITKPVLSGTAAVGEELTCSQGTWENSPTGYTYAWRNDGNLISGQANSTYTVQSADAGHGISCEVTASNASGSGSAASNTLNVPPKPVSTVSPSLTGTPAVGQTLTCSHGSWENSPTSYVYAWKRDGSAISGQTASTYTVQSADAGHGISCEVTATNGGGSATATSNTLNVPPKPVNTTAPSLTGTLAVGQTLTCSHGSWENSPTSYVYAWKRDGSAISGQTASTYTVQSADAGHGISCEVTATNGGGSASASSNTLQIPAPPAPSPEPTPPPPAPSGNPGLGVASAVATVSGGSVLIPLQCVGGESCQGIIKLIARITAQRHGKRASASRAKGAQNVVIGTAHYSLGAGQHATIHVKLTGKGKALLRHAGKHGLKVELTGTDVKTRMVKLKSASGGRHHH